MRYPEFMKPGDTIGFIAPSFGCTTEPYKSGFAEAQRVLKAKGFGLDLGPNCYASDGIGISSTPDNCAQELMEYYRKEDNQVLFSCGGGELMCEILPYLDLEALRQAKPKWYMGNSDNTNFTFLSATALDTAAIYGPNASTFGMRPWSECVTDAFMLLQGKQTAVHSYELWQKESLKDEEHPLEPYNLTEPVVIRRFPDQDVKVEGRLLGGCLDCLCNMSGTRFDYVKQFNEKYGQEGIIWFLEACDLNVLGIRRAIWQLKESGWFEKVKAFLIGRPYIYGEEIFGLDQYRAVTDLLEEFDVPILMDLDIGHVPPAMPLVVGASVIVKSVGNKLAIEYTWK